MNNIVTWQVTGLTVLSSVEELSNVVIRVGWQATAISPKGTTAETGTITEVPAPDAESFTPYDKLTPEEVIGWVHGVLGEQGVNAVTITLDRIIEEQENPTPCPTPLPLPWLPAR